MTMSDDPDAAAPTDVSLPASDPLAPAPVPPAAMLATEASVPLLSLLPLAPPPLPPPAAAFLLASIKCKLTASVDGFLDSGAPPSAAADPAAPATAAMPDALTVTAFDPADCAEGGRESDGEREGDLKTATGCASSDAGAGARIVPVPDVGLDSALGAGVVGRERIGVGTVVVEADEMDAAIPGGGEASKGAPAWSSSSANGSSANA